ncbi:MAG: asparagine synthase (glutamine-hydrolyzing) [Proteobacteria bacterium]|nr:asparagine synthase (glutamine-hydrolyzing) [Pseudomonadota bacterium]
MPPRRNSTKTWRRSSGGAGHWRAERMCGLSGALFSSAQPLAPLSPLLTMLAHRGPDGTGLLWREGGRPQRVAQPDAMPPQSDTLWVHHRLAVIDVSAQAAQPFSDETGRWWLVFNGEIYNYLELREELMQQGVRFSTQSDTEVLLAAFLHWGEGCWQRLHGMWAAVIWDARDDVFTFSRDRFGMKPLYYAQAEQGLYFASEIKALLPLLRQRPGIHMRAAADFLASGTSDHLEESFFSGVYTFPPAHYATWRRGQNLKPQRYWQLERHAQAANAGELRALLGQSVAEHLRSDVTLGMCLSGGLDSSALLALAHEKTHAQPHCFTAVHAGFAQDERRWAEAMARHVQSPWHAVAPTPEKLLADWDALLWHQEQPFGSFSIYAQYCVQREAAAAGMKVVLSGQGADEALCGYSKYYYYYLSLLARGGKLGVLAHEAACLPFFGDPRLFEPARLIGFARGRAAAALLEGGSPPGPAPASLQDWQDMDIFQRSLPAILRFEDRNSMAFSVESRLPFLDHRWFAYAYRLPDTSKLHHGRSKALLREARATP